MKPVYGITLQGVRALKVEVEVEITGGLFVIGIIWLPDAAVRNLARGFVPCSAIFDIPRPRYCIRADLGLESR